MNLRTVEAPPKFSGEKLKFTFDWTPQLNSGQADALDGDPTAVADQVSVTVNGISTTNGVTSFTVGTGGLPGFNLEVMLTANTAGGQILQARIIVPITSR